MKIAFSLLPLPFGSVSVQTSGCPDLTAICCPLILQLGLYSVLSFLTVPPPPASVLFLRQGLESLRVWHPREYSGGERQWRAVGVTGAGATLGTTSFPEKCRT